MAIYIILTILITYQASVSALKRKLHDTASHLTKELELVPIDKVENFIKPDYSHLDIINDIMLTRVIWLNLTSYCLNSAKDFFCC